MKLLYKYNQKKIKWEEMTSRPQDMVILARDNRYLRYPMLRKLEPAVCAKAIYSMWHGYLDRTDLLKLLESLHIEFVEIHTGGHAHVEDLQQTADALRPRSTVPIHTFNPEEFPKLFPNVVLLEDGEEYMIPDRE